MCMFGARQMRATAGCSGGACTRYWLRAPQRTASCSVERGLDHHPSPCSIASTGVPSALPCHRHHAKPMTLFFAPRPVVLLPAGLLPAALQIAISSEAPPALLLVASLVCGGGAPAAAMIAAGLIPLDRVAKKGRFLCVPP